MRFRADAHSSRSVARTSDRITALLLLALFVRQRGLIVSHLINFGIQLLDERVTEYPCHNPLASGVSTNTAAGPSAARLGAFVTRAITDFVGNVISAKFSIRPRTFGAP